MSGVPYRLSDLVPKGLYATQVRELLAETRQVIAALPEGEFRRDKLDYSLREVAARSQVAPTELFKVVRVALAWPNARPDLFEVMMAQGKDGTLERLEAALTRVTDEARR
jgi:hypothetical protein